MSSWGLSLFVLFEPQVEVQTHQVSSWGLSLFVLFELMFKVVTIDNSSWGLSLFVLFEQTITNVIGKLVLED